MLRLKLWDEGEEVVLFEGNLEEIVEYLKNNYEIFNFIWESITEEYGINYTIPYEYLEGKERELFIEKMPQFKEIYHLRYLEYELDKVDMSWWTLVVEEVDR